MRDTTPVIIQAKDALDSDRKDIDKINFVLDLFRAFMIERAAEKVFGKAGKD